MKWLRNIVGSLTLVLILNIIILGTPVQAVDHTEHYDLNGQTWADPDNVTWWYLQEGSNDFYDEVLTAACAWIYAGTEIYMVEVDNRNDSVLRIYSNDYGDTGWYGCAQYWLTWRNIYLNEYYSRTDLQWSIIAAHEMGHTHGLGHYDNCTYELMNSAPCDRGYVSPYIGDICGINDKY
jgi:hypothetical protein